MLIILWRSGRGSGGVRPRRGGVFMLSKLSGGSWPSPDATTGTSSTSTRMSGGPGLGLLLLGHLHPRLHLDPSHRRRVLVRGLPASRGQCAAEVDVGVADLSKAVAQEGVTDGSGVAQLHAGGHEGAPEVMGRDIGQYCPGLEGAIFLLMLVRTLCRGRWSIALLPIFRTSWGMNRGWEIFYSNPELIPGGTRAHPNQSAGSERPMPAPWISPGCDNSVTTEKTATR